MITEERYYLRIWLGSLRKFNISLSQAALLMLVMSLSNKRGYCYASKKKLGEILGMSAVTVHAKINRLKKKDLLEAVEPSIDVASSCYRVSPIWQQYVEELTEAAREGEWESFNDTPPFS